MSCIGGVQADLKQREERVEGKQDSRERDEDMGRHEHLLLKEIREMAVPQQPAVKLCFR